MMKLIVSLTLLWTICSSVGALQCQSCSDSQCLNVMTVTCSSETMCIRATTRARILSNTRDEFIKACAPSSLCPSTGNRTFQSNSGVASTVTLAECCDTDNCNTGTLPVPSRNVTRNGLRCNFCANPSVCDVNVDCEGFEDRCYRATVVSGGSTPTIGGCVSTNLVEAGSSLLAFSQLLSVGTISSISSISSCSSSLCLDLTAPPVTTASSNTTSQASSGSTSTTAASGTSGGSTAASGGSGASTTASGGSGASTTASGGSGASTTASGGSGSGGSGASTTASGGSGSGGSGASTTASGGSGSGGSGASTAASGGSGSGSGASTAASGSGSGGSGATTAVNSASSQSLDAGFIRLGMINLLLGLFTLILW